MGKRATELYTEMAEKGQADLDFSGIIKMLQGAF
jgi:3-hydroxyisobutyrate dehydrogenase-like beta-hydroxyacid dehydrogenase